ncbi:MAG TPA: hypothetical protein VEU74_13115 [Gemmatimonadales bacterium]|nr:hypothetical protein [Gemmatimonadales bacterium]
MECFPLVEATYRTNLRELNEVNFARFDAKLEQRFAELDAKWAGRWTALDAKLDRSLAELESRLTWRMFAFWAPTALATIGTALGVVSLLLRR